jgi:DNA-binding NarL/FixJ family response regulator
LDSTYRPPIRILVADSIQRVRTAVRELLDLQIDMQVVGEAADGSTTLVLAQQLRPDLTLLDMRLHDTDCLRLAADLHRTHPSMALVFYTANPCEGTLEVALQAGAACFVEKGASPQLFLQALRQAATSRPSAVIGAGGAPEGDQS